MKEQADRACGSSAHGQTDSHLLVLYVLLHEEVGFDGYVGNHTRKFQLLVMGLTLSVLVSVPVPLIFYRYCNFLVGYHIRKIAVPVLTSKIIVQFQ